MTVNDAMLKFYIVKVFQSSVTNHLFDYLVVWV